MNEGINKAYKIKKITNDCDWLYVRHDDLHLNLKLTIYKVASFLGIVESETLLKIPWVAKNGAETAHLAEL